MMKSAGEDSHKQLSERLQASFGTRLKVREEDRKSDRERVRERERERERGIRMA